MCILCVLFSFPLLPAVPEEERLAAEKGLVGGGELGAREAAWKRAFLNTPHGQPILLEAGEEDGHY